jgi:hypothetical protein
MLILSKIVDLLFISFHFQSEYISKILLSFYGIIKRLSGIPFKEKLRSYLFYLLIS